MKKLTDLFTLMELTRSMPQYGYILSGVKRDDLSNLAEHHYLVTFIAWQIALHLKSKGAKLDVGKVMEFAMVHDLGELFGGDISMPYAKVNPKAREYAKMFEEENQRFFAKFFGEQENHFKNLGHEILDAASDEALVAKFSDYVEHAHFKNFLKFGSKKFDMGLAVPKLKELISKMKDKIIRKEMSNFLKVWSKDVGKKNVNQILYEAK